MRSLFRTSLFYIAVLCVSNTSLFAQDASPWIVADLNARSLEFVSHTAEEQGFTSVLQGAAGKILVTAVSPKAADRLQDVYRILDELSKWKNIEVGEMSFVLYESELHLTVLPKKMTVDSVDFLVRLPAGLKFFMVDSRIWHDIRLITETHVLRLQGRYSNETALLATLKSALASPQMYSSDFLLARLSDDLETLKKENALLVEQLEENKKRFEQNEQFMSWLARASVAMLSKGFFSPPVAPEEETVQKVVDAKNASPLATVRELYQGLKASGLTLTEKQVRYIIAVYFGEF